MTDELCFASATWLAKAIATRDVSSARGRRRVPRADRRPSTRASTRSSVWRTTPGTGPARPTRTLAARRLARPAPRRPVHDQGLARHRRRRHDRRHGRLARPRARPRRHGRRAAQGRGRDPPRQDEHAGVHLVGRDRQRRLRPDLEPVRPRRARRAAAAAVPAAIVAAGGSPFDIGSDTGDSIRQPAHVCGIAGLKPTSGRVPRTGHWPSFRGPRSSRFTQLGPIARRVEDLALLLPVIAGPDGEDPHVAPVRARRPGGGRRRRACGSSRSATTASGRRRRRRSSRSRRRRRPLGAAGARVRGARAAGPRRCLGRLGRDDPGRRLRLAAAADRRRPGRPGSGSYDTRGWIASARRRSPGDALTALVERADAVRARLLRWFAATST